MRVFVAQLNPTVGAIEKNCQKILQSIERAKQQKADLVVFPELVLCGYPPEDLLLHPSFVEAQQRALEQIRQASSSLIVLVGLVRKSNADSEKFLFNSVAVIENGKLLGFVDKQLLPTYDVFDERRYFEPGKESQIWNFKEMRVGILICEDIWQHVGDGLYTHYPKDPVLQLLPLKPDLVINVSASPYRTQKLEVRNRVFIKCAQTLSCPVIGACQVGGNDQLVFDGHSPYVNARGELVQMAKGFEEDEVLFDLKAPTQPLSLSYDPAEDMYKALVLGVQDYFHKLGFKKGCLGLSGGIDSALVACIAVEALGKENVLVVLMPSRYSSEGSIADAQLLAERLEIETLLLPIEPLFKAFLDVLGPLFKEKGPTITEENVQSRIRGTLLMALSNKQGNLLLGTSNKSELGMGYCTLYGDMCGGLSPLSDVTKGQVYELCHFINRRQELIPKAILDKSPSAELRSNQKDSDSLPPYETIDQVIEGYVEEFLSPEEIAKNTKIPLGLVEELVRKIHLAEYKRLQSPPGIRVSRRAFKVGRRYPIAQKWM